MNRMKSLDEKLKRIHANPTTCGDFILADAKDADMALAIGATGRTTEKWPDGSPRFRTLAEYRQIIGQIVEQGLVDIMLMSASTSEDLTIQKRIFDNSAVTPACRANDTTDIHVFRGGKSPGHPSLPFRTATIDHIQCGKLHCSPSERQLGANLGLYSITYTNDPVRDREALLAYNAFRLEAEEKGFRHFLEVFDPNVEAMVAPEHLGGFINDAIVRTLGGVTRSGRPDFLKIVYHGPRAMEELVAYDPHLVVGILGGSAGTTYDAFKLLAEAKKYGGRVALFGRKINQAENQLAFIHFLRLIADGEIGPEEAVKAYHGVLQALGVTPNRSLADDMVLQTGVMSYGGTKTTSLPPAQAKPGVTSSPAVAPYSKPVTSTPLAIAAKSVSANNPVKPAQPLPSKVAVPASSQPDFSKMTSAEKVAWQRARWNRILG